MARQTIQEITKDIWLCIALLALGALTILRVNTGPSNTKLALTESLTHATLPTAYAGILLGLTLAILVMSLRSLRRLRSEKAAASPPAPAPAERPTRRRRHVRTWGTVLLLTLYVALLPRLPFAVLTTFYLASMFTLYGQRSALKIGLVSGLGGVGLHLLFITLLNLPL